MRLTEGELHNIEAMTRRHRELEEELADFDRRLMAIESGSDPQYIVSDGGRGAYNCGSSFYWAA